MPAAKRKELKKGNATAATKRNRAADAQVVEQPEMSLVDDGIVYEPDVIQPDDPRQIGKLLPTRKSLLFSPPKSVVS